MPEYLQSMPTKHTWTFKPRLRANAFGWKGSHLACQRLKEAVTEIKKVDRAAWFRLKCRHKLQILMTS